MDSPSPNTKNFSRGAHDDGVPFEIWSPQPDFEGGFTGLYVDEDFFSEFCMRCVDRDSSGRFIGTSVAEIWDGALFHVDRGLADNVVGDFVINPEFRMIAMGEAVRELFEPRYGRFGEFLEATVTGMDEPVYMFNLLLRKPVIDWTVSTRALPGHSEDEHQLFFIQEELEPGSLFLDEVFLNKIFTVECGDRKGFKAFCERGSLTGLAFKRWYPHALDQGHGH